MNKYKEYFKFYWQLVKPHFKKQLLVFTIWLLSASLGLISPYLTKILIDDVLVQQTLRYLYLYIICRVLLYLFKLIIDTTQSIVSTKFNYNLLFDLQFKLYNQMQSKNMLFFYKNRPGDIINRISNETGYVLSLFGTTIMSIIVQIYSLVAITIIMLTIDLKFTLVVLGVLPLIIVNLKYFNGKFRDINGKILNSNGKLVNTLQENVHSMSTIKTHNSQEYASKRLMRRIKEYLAHQFTLVYIHISCRNISSIIKFVPQILFLYVGGKSVIDRNLSVGEMIAFLSYITMIYEPINVLVNVNVELQKSFVAFKRYYDTYKDDLEGTANVIDEKLQKSINMIENIDIDNISFSYDNESNIIDNFSMFARQGDLVIIRGQNGQGKSTLLNLISGLYKPNDGEIRFNNIPLQEIKTDCLVKSIGIVSQSTYLYRDTIEENIKLGRAVTTSNISKFIDQLSIFDFIGNLSLGLQTKVIDGGNNFSGGQKQKIGIIRGLINNPSLILFDEPTASLDQTSYDEFVKYINQIKIDKIIIMITHDQRMIDIATKVIELKQDSLELSSNN